MSRRQHEVRISIRAVEYGLASMLVVGILAGILLKEPLIKFLRNEFVKSDPTEYGALVPYFTRVVALAWAFKKLYTMLKDILGVVIYWTSNINLARLARVCLECMHDLWRNAFLFLYSLRMIPFLIMSGLAASWWRALRDIYLHFWIVVMLFLIWVFSIYGIQAIIELIPAVARASFRTAGEALLQTSDVLFDVAGPEFEYVSADINVLELNLDGSYSNVVYRTLKV